MDLRLNGELSAKICSYMNSKRKSENLWRLSESTTKKAHGGLGIDLDKQPGVEASGSFVWPANDANIRILEWAISVGDLWF